jgi:hypothetical protein
MSKDEREFFNRLERPDPPSFSEVLSSDTPLLAAGRFIGSFVTVDYPSEEPLFQFQLKIVYPRPVR